MEKTNRSGESVNQTSQIIISILLMSLLPLADASAKLSKEDIQKLKDRGKKEGWTFEVGENEATQYDLNQLCGQFPLTPEQELERQMQVQIAAKPLLSEAELPSSFDWRHVTGCPPIRNQMSCGSCWAFSAIGAIECAIKIYDGDTVDLSEQWLVSCTSAGTCGGGWID